jgi:hypothetical protein
LRQDATIDQHGAVGISVRTCIDPRTRTRCGGDTRTVRSGTNSFTGDMDVVQVLEDVARGLRAVRRIFREALHHQLRELRRQRRH